LEEIWTKEGKGRTDEGTREGKGRTDEGTTDEGTREGRTDEGTREGTREEVETVVAVVVMERQMSRK